MVFQKKILALSILGMTVSSAWADQNNNIQTLDTIQVTAHPLVQSAADFAVADQVIDHDKLAMGATTIGDALAGQLGVYSNQFGSGSSRPVIRGQEGARVKVLQHASETADVSSLSPDHTVTVAPILAKQVEVIRGPSTLLYAAGTVGGLVNVTDQKIPTQMPEDGLEGTVGVRYNSGSDEKLASAGVTAGLGDQFAIRVEGSKHKANNYIAPDYVVAHPHDDHFHYEKKERVDNTFAEGETINVGGSWIHDRGFIGLSYSNRQDQYGLPGHSHGEEEHGHGHDEHAEEAGAWIDLKSERYEIRTELEQPFIGFEKLRGHLSYTDYQHDELEGHEAMSNFKSKGYDGRLEFVHVPVKGWEGVVGTQFSQQKVNLSATEHEEDHDSDHDHDHDLLMADTKSQKYSLFALEHKQMGNVHVEVGARVDHQKIKVDSIQKDYSDTAFSGSAALNWAFAPSYKLSVVGSHQQRLPIAQELYAQGKHHATQTLEHGNDQLDLEKSNNLELGLHYEGEKLDYHVHLYHNWFDNYIYAADTGEEDHGYREVEYRQDSAKFYGTEAEVSYRLNDTYKVSVFGDYVRAKIDSANAPRIPAGRLGTKVEADFADGWSGLAEYYHVFEQNKIASYETATQGYNMVNVGMSYANTFADKNAYRVYLKANNLLDDQIYSHTSFLSNIPQVGRNFSLGLEYKF